MPAPRPSPERAVHLVGLSREAVQDRLGPAAFVRRDGPVQIWRYASEDCFLELFLYRESDTFRVHHVEARPKDPDQKGAAPITVNGCYGRLVAARRSGGTG